MTSEYYRPKCWKSGVSLGLSEEGPPRNLNRKRQIATDSTYSFGSTERLKNVSLLKHRWKKNHDGRHKAGVSPDLKINMYENAVVDMMTFDTNFLSPQVDR